MRLCWNWQTGKLEVLVSERVYGFESRWPHQIWATKKILSEKGAVAQLTDQVGRSDSSFLLQIMKCFQFSTLK